MHADRHARRTTHSWRYRVPPDTRVLYVVCLYAGRSHAREPALSGTSVWWSSAPWYMQHATHRHIGRERFNNSEMAAEYDPVPFCEARRDKVNQKFRRVEDAGL